MKKKLIVHAGAHKTGSTFIQRIFSKNTMLLRRYGAAYFGGNDARINFTRNILYPSIGLRSGGENSNAYRKQANDILHERIGGHNILFLSNENILGYCDLAKSDGYLYPRANKALDFICSLQDSWDIKIVFLVRDYGDFIESSYIQKIKEGYTYDFQEYIRNIELHKMDWPSIVNDMTSRFGTGNVMVGRYENFKKDQQVFIGNIMQVLSGLALDLKIDENANANPSYSSIALELAKNANRLLSKVDLEDYRGFLTRRFSIEKYGRPKLLTEAERDRFRQKYESDCVHIGL